jgi:hypothetical protein
LKTSFNLNPNPSFSHNLNPNPNHKAKVIVLPLLIQLYLQQFSIRFKRISITRLSLSFNPKVKIISKLKTLKT